MSKLNNTIYEINNIDALSNEDKWMNKIHPLIKFILTIIYILLVVSFHKYNMTGIIGMFIYPIVIFIIADISFKDSMKKMRIVLPLVCFIGLFNPLFDKQILFSINGIPISGGIISMITLMMKGALAVLASYILIVTTNIEKICYAMESIYIPKVFITQVLLIYRYLTVLLKEANHISEAYSLRAPNQKGIHYKVWGSLIGQLLLRSMDKAENIYQSMCLRGYTGEFSYAHNIKYDSRDYTYFIAWLTIFITIRFVNISEIMGNILF